MPSWTEADKTKALAVARRLGAAEASRATGIPAGTIRSWLCRSQQGTGRKAQRNRKTARNATPPTTAPANQKARALEQEVMAKAVEEAGEYVRNRLKGLADRLYGLAEKAAEKIDTAISDPKELPQGKKCESHDRDGAAWLRSLVGVLAQSIEKGQLLAGKPTGRTEVLTGEKARAKVAGKLDELAARREQKKAG